MSRSRQLLLSAALCLASIGLACWFLVRGEAPREAPAAGAAPPAAVDSAAQLHPSELAAETAELQRARVELDSRPRAPIDVLEPESVWLRLRVEDARGAPLGEARVWYFARRRPQADLDPAEEFLLERETSSSVRRIELSRSFRGRREHEDPPLAGAVPARSQGDGSFLLHGVPEAGSDVYVLASGFRGRRLAVAELSAARTVAIELVRLEPLARVRGRCLLPDGRAARGARVRIADPGDDAARTARDRVFGVSYGFGVRAHFPWTLESLVSAVDPSFEVTTDEQGAFELAVPPAGRMVVEALLVASESETRAEAGGSADPNADPSAGPRWYAAEERAAEAAEGLDLVLQRRPQFRGRVLAPGSGPAAGQDVRLRHAGLPEEASRGDTRRAPTPGSLTATDARGEFTFHDLSPGRHVARLIGTVCTQVLELQVREHDTQQEFVLDFRPCVGGTLRDARGLPLHGGRVGLHYLGSEALPAPEREAHYLSENRNGITREDGTFRFECLAPGSYRLTATHPDWLASRPLLLEIAPGEERLDLSLRLRAGAHVRGVARDEQGRPPRGWTVRYAPAAAPDAQRSVPTDGQGAFVLSGLEPGAWVFSAEFEPAATNDAGSKPDAAAAPRSAVRELRCAEGGTVDVELSPDA